ncbi:MAG: ATP-dependent helicase [Mycobacteriaceae bacterium]|nr:ATP-dependent helicase [Mycobacteriaceae bacterium]
MAFSAATRTWFDGAFPAPTSAQTGAWKAISAGENTLVVAPTGSGKTLSAFLWALDRLANRSEPAAGTTVVYVSPLKALAVDVERNLRAPLVGITQTAKRLGLAPPEISVGVRSGDTTPAARRAMLRTPPDILITTPESLFLLLTSAARETLRAVQTVIVDEVHALAGSKRGAHLALTLARLDAALDRPAQRIGLSATVRPPEEVGRFLVGHSPITIVNPPAPKTFDLTVRVPVPDMTALDEEENSSIWPLVDADIVDLVLRHRSSIVFVNSRRQAERLTARLNEVYAERAGAQAPVDAAPRTPAPVGTAPRTPALIGPTTAVNHGADPVLARAHHGSVSKEQRAVIEDDLKAGRLRCVVATSSLELGIDMGAVDLVVQVAAPPSVASGLQRVGRAGHQVGEVSRGVMFPKHRTDVLHCAVSSLRMAAGQIERLTVPANPLDILAQQTVAACALEPIDADVWFDTVRRTGSFATLPRSAYESVLDLLSGRYPSDEFAELRPRVVWDRDAGTLTGRPGAQRLAVTSGGAIPDRGLFPVFLVGEKLSRVGELDEERVYESRVGDVFALGSTSWRIEEITHDRVLVSPAFGLPGRLPFWHGDSLGRPAELGRALGAFLRQSREDLEAQCAEAGLDDNATANLLKLLADQREATGHLPTDRTMVVERFRDELGDWRVVLHSPYGLPVHAPLALAVGARLQQRYGIDAAPTASDDGIVVRLPDTDNAPPGADLFVFEPDELDDIVTEQVGGSALFASRFRECAARALLLPRRDPGKRSPLWQQRQRAAQLLDVAHKYPTFPILLETVRECLQDVYDLPSLQELCKDWTRRRIRLVEVETASPSPFANSLLFDYVGQFMYEGDNPLAERRAAALSLDSTLLAELLGRVELRELLDATVLEQTARELQRLTPERQIRDAEGLADLLRLLGPLSAAEIQDRAQPDSDTAQWLSDLSAAKRVLEAACGGGRWWVAVEDAARLRDALGVPLPIGTPAAFIEPVADPLGDLVARYARTHGPFTTADAARRFALGPAVVDSVLRRLCIEKRVTEGEFTPDATGREWCDTEVLRRLRRRSLAAARKDVEPVSTPAFGRFLPDWQHVGPQLRGVDGVAAVVEQLAGVPIPASAWESLILPSRVSDYAPALLDELAATGEVLWSGHGSLTARDGWIALHLAEQAPFTLLPAAEIDLTDTHRAVLATLDTGGGYFFRQLAEASPTAAESELVAALWDLAWSGLISGDTFAPVRALLAGTVKASTSHRAPRRAPRARYRTARPTPPVSAAPATAAGRWSVLPRANLDPTARTHAAAEQLLERYGVLTKGSVASEGVPGGFALMYRVLTEFEDRGRARRGYFVDSLGGAQFSTSAVVDRLRSCEVDPLQPRARAALALAATDPANPYGAALPWPKTTVQGHRPGRKAGALVVLVDGEPAMYLERGGRTLLTFTADAQTLTAAAESLAGLVRGGRVDSLVIDRIDGDSVHGHGFAPVLTAAGFAATPRGIRLRR